MAAGTSWRLALRAEVARALSLCDQADQGTASAAALTIAFIDVELLAEGAGIAVGAHVITQCRAAGADRGAEGGAHGAQQARAIALGEPAGAATRMDAGAKQGLAGVDVADARDQPGVHQYLFDGDTAPSGDATQVGGIEVGRKGLGRQMLQQAVAARLLERVVQTAEAT